MPFLSRSVQIESKSPNATPYVSPTIRAVVIVVCRQHLMISLSFVDSLWAATGLSGVRHGPLDQQRSQCYCFNEKTSHSTTSRDLGRQREDQVLQSCRRRKTCAFWRIRSSIANCTRGPNRTPWIASQCRYLRKPVSRNHVNRTEAVSWLHSTTLWTSNWMCSLFIPRYLDSISTNRSSRAGAVLCTDARSHAWMLVSAFFAAPVRPWLLDGRAASWLGDSTERLTVWVACRYSLNGKARLPRLLKGPDAR